MQLLRDPSAEALVSAGLTSCPRVEGAIGADVAANYQFLLRSTHVSTFKHDLTPPVCYAYGATRRPGTGSLSNGRSTDAAATLFQADAEIRGAEDWLLRADYSASKPSPIQERQIARLEQIKKLLLSILPGVQGIRITQPSESLPTPAVEFETHYGWVPLKALGLGYQTMIGWTVDLASRLVERYPDSPDPLAEAAVVLVDEIDLHLHPAWQRQLIDHLTRVFANTQFIVTAHSPLIVQGAAGANIAVLRREGDHVVIDNDVESIRGWRVDQVLTSDLFDLPSARPPKFDEKLGRRLDLLSQPTLSDADKREIQNLEAEIGVLPSGESAQDAKRMIDLAERTHELLKKYGG
jgi:hypothetical protein